MRDACINAPSHHAPLYASFSDIVQHNLPWGHSGSWRPSFYISPGSPGLSPTQLCTSLYRGALSWTSTLLPLSFSHAWAASALHKQPQKSKLSKNLGIEKDTQKNKVKLKKKNHIIPIIIFFGKLCIYAYQASFFVFLWFHCEDLLTPVNKTRGKVEHGTALIMEILEKVIIQTCMTSSKTCSIIVNKSILRGHHYQ